MGSCTRRQMDASHSAFIPINITDAVLRLHRCLLTLTTRPFRSTVTSAASGGGVATTIPAQTSASGGGSTATVPSQTSPASTNHRHELFLVDNYVPSGSGASKTLTFYDGSGTGCQILGSDAVGGWRCHGVH